MMEFKEYLQGGDLRSITDVEELVELIDHQDNFDKLFKYLFSDDRLIAIRAIDAVEKITKKHPEYLNRFKNELIDLLGVADHKEFKWHLAQLVSRLELRGEKLIKAWNQLMNWAEDKSESKIVRVNSLQALYDIQERHSEFSEDFQATIEKVKKQGVASMNARIRQFNDLYSE